MTQEGRDLALAYTNACSKYGVEPALEISVELRKGGDIECCLAHRTRPLTDAAVDALSEGLADNTVTILDLEGNAITWRGAASLSNIIKRSSRLKTARIGENCLEDVGCKVLSEAVEVSTSLEKFDLRANRITAVGAEAISEALKKNKSITQLSLPKNAIDDAGCKHIASSLFGNSKLQLLSLRFNDVSDDGVQQLADALPHSSLTSLDLGGNRITSLGAAALAKSIALPNSKLLKLNLRSNSSGLEGINAFAETLSNPTCRLEELYIGFNGVPLPAAIRLLRSLLNNTSLKNLDLQGVLLDSEGEKAVAELIERGTTLRQLVTELDADVTGINICNALLKNTTLDELSVGDSQVIATPIITEVLRGNRLLKTLSETSDIHANQLHRYIVKQRCELPVIPLTSDEFQKQVVDVVVNKLLDFKKMILKFRQMGNFLTHTPGRETPKTEAFSGKDIVHRGLATLSPRGSGPVSVSPNTGWEKRTGTPTASTTTNPTQRKLLQTPERLNTNQTQNNQSTSSKYATESNGTPTRQQDVSFLLDTIKTLQSQVKDLQTSQQRLHSEHATASPTKQNTDQNMQIMSTAISQLKTGFEQLQLSQRQCESNIEHVVSILGHCLDLKAGETLQAAIAKNTDSCTDLDSRLNQITSTIESQEAAITRLRKDQDEGFTGAHDMLQSMQQQYNSMESQSVAVNEEVSERLKNIEDGHQSLRNRLQSVETDCSQAMQSQSSQRLKLDQFSKRIDELLANQSGSLSDRLADLEILNGDVSRQQTVLSASVEDLTTKVSTWFGHIKVLKPKVDEIRDAVEGFDQVRSRVARLELETTSNHQQHELEIKKYQKAISKVPQDNPTTVSQINLLTEEFTKQGGAIDALKENLQSLRESMTESKNTQYAGIESTQQQVKFLASELQEVIKKQQQDFERTAEGLTMSSRVADTTAGNSALLYTTQNGGSVITDIGESRTQLHKELALLREETAEAQSLTAELKRRLESTAQTPSGIGWTGGGDNPADDKLQKLQSRMDLLEEVLKRDQKASLIALQAIVAERAAPVPTSPGMPVTPPPGNWYHEKKSQHAAQQQQHSGPAAFSYPAPMPLFPATPHSVRGR
eukprot:TRINITY_DN4936_c0_g1_i1.p1 TRINITY_DN4936_c0_g1~~TRINITY_DN4936_c0_g1_i1.p1  ORF type:complete len:1101 (+),score=274.74 TRINITY_DN4936_c0_g1_i1:50-3352(+)